MEFPAPHVHAPRATHTHTVILLHGRGSNGAEFAEELFASVTSRKKSLPACLPGWRWVFPTSRDRWTTAFQEEMRSWFDAYSLSNIQERQALQIEGLRESVSHTLDVLEHEIQLLGGKASRLYLGGISQGMATALWTAFCVKGRVDGPIGGFLGFCGWLPFADQVEHLFQRSLETNAQSRVLGRSRVQHLVSDFCVETIGITKPPPVKDAESCVPPLLATRVLLGHGTDDAYVPVELGRQTFRVLREVMDHVEWKDFSGAEGEGHWIKEPEGFDDIVEFLEAGPA
ncbi:Alpha/Beta hydrolase protein [Aspergillus aurantiobrunneus]